MLAIDWPAFFIFLSISLIDFFIVYVHASTFPSQVAKRILVKSRSDFILIPEQAMFVIMVIGSFMRGLAQWLVWDEFSKTANVATSDDHQLNLIMGAFVGSIITITIWSHCVFAPENSQLSLGLVMISFSLGFYVWILVQTAFFASFATVSVPMVMGFVYVVLLTLWTLLLVITPNKDSEADQNRRLGANRETQQHPIHHLIDDKGISWKRDGSTTEVYQPNDTYINSLEDDKGNVWKMVDGKMSD
jgi:hypothetical protein